MTRHEPIRYSPFRIRECSDAEKRVPVQVQRTGLGFVVVRPAQQTEAKPLGRTPLNSEQALPAEERKPGK